MQQHLPKAGYFKPIVIAQPCTFQDSPRELAFPVSVSFTYREAGAENVQNPDQAREFQFGAHIWARRKFHGDLGSYVQAETRDKLSLVVSPAVIRSLAEHFGVNVQNPKDFEAFTVNFKARIANFRVLSGHWAEVPNHDQSAVKVGELPEHLR